MKNAYTFEQPGDLTRYTAEDSEKRLVLTDVPFGGDPLQKLDLCIPKALSGDAGLILYVHGGGFVHGDKAEYLPQMKADSESGFVCAAVNYRFVSPEIGIDDMTEDITHALLLIRDIAAGQGIRLRKMLMTGGSAGAHLLLYYAYAFADTAPILPAAAVAYCPSTNVAERKMIFQTQVGSPENMAIRFSQLAKCSFTPDTLSAAVPALEKISSLYYVNEKTVPTVIAHGLLDEAVPYDQAQMLDEKLAACGVPHTLVTYPHSGHPLDKDPDKAAETHRLLLEYAEKYLCG